ncbi:PAS domain-containing protein [Hyphomonas sp. NPDC076900]|uniref:PAS domain-containing protein n=1 Tax=unclassified Hyphomonas TaxID=2630699 RepID=UPI003CFFFE3A
MTHDMTSPPAGRKHNDPVLARALQAIAFCGVILGLVLYAWVAVHNETGASQRRLADAAAAGQVAADAEMARIEAAAERTAPLIAAAMRADVSAEDLRKVQAQVADMLSSTPVLAVAVLDGKGGVLSVFGPMPADAVGGLAPLSSSQRAGQELLGLDLVPVSRLRTGFYREAGLAGGGRLPMIFVLRSGAFGAALDAGAAAGSGWRAALFNLDGKVVRSSSAPGRAFTPSDAALAGQALGWQPLHKDQVSAPGRLSGRTDGAFLEVRSVAGGGLHIAYLGDEPSVLAIIAARRTEFLALFGVSMLALVLALSLIQNEWRRDDAENEDAFLVLAQARASCDLLDAGVIDWSLRDGRIVYSEGWADMFARGVKPASEEAHDWISRIHPQDQDAARETYQSMLDGRVNDIEHRIRIRLPSGLWVQVLERGRAVSGLDGMPARIVLVQTPQAADGAALKETLSGLGQSKDYALAG